MPRSSILVLVVLASCRSTSDLSERSGWYSVNDHTLNLQCTGGPAPRVVIDAGLGESSDSWTDVATMLTDLSVCVFDRAGYGGSSLGTAPRTPQNNAADLGRLLDVASVEEPVVLVGHSLGALNAQAFWKEFPDRVLGLVLLDPPPRAWLEGQRFSNLWVIAVEAGQELQARAAGAAPDSREGRLFRAAASEHAGMLDEGRAVTAISSFRDLPLLVVAAGRANPAFGDSAEAYQDFWAEESAALSARSSRGRFRRLETVGHNMNREAPGLIADLIRDFVSRLSGRAGPNSTE